MNMFNTESIVIAVCIIATTVGFTDIVIRMFGG